MQGSTTIITTDKKRFEIEDVSFASDDDVGVAREGRGSLKGGLDSETASQCGGLESASTNSIQSDSHVIPLDSSPYLQSDGGLLHHPGIASAVLLPSTGHSQGNLSSTASQGGLD